MVCTCYTYLHTYIRIHTLSLSHTLTHLLCAKYVPLSSLSVYLFLAFFGLPVLQGRCIFLSFTSCSFFFVLFLLIRQQWRAHRVALTPFVPKPSGTKGENSRLGHTVANGVVCLRFVTFRHFHLSHIYDKCYEASRRSRWKSRARSCGMRPG